MLNGVMQTGKNVGMITMDDSLRNLYAKGLISREECESRAEDKSVMKHLLQVLNRPPAFFILNLSTANFLPMPSSTNFSRRSSNWAVPTFTSARASRRKSASTAASSPSPTRSSRARIMETMMREICEPAPGIVSGKRRSRLRLRDGRGQPLPLQLPAQQNGYAAVFRIIPTKIASLEQLGIPPVVKEFGHMRSGLVLVTGPTGSGKSTTLAALLDYININFRRHIITIEEPIEFVHRNKKSIITQREVPIQTPIFADGLRAALREDADIVLVGEMRDLETISLALTAAETGLLVFGTLHTNNARKTVDRIIDVFPSDQQSQVRTMLAASLKGVVAQLLMKKADGKGRAAVNEIMVSNASRRRHHP
jgi:Tfp pilus assembly pilus retraction ATPase PilT